MSKTKVGILGFGNLGEYLVENILSNPRVKNNFELAFVQNRSAEKISNADLPILANQVLGADITSDLKQFIEREHDIDLIIEASHPDIIREHGLNLIQHASLFITSLTALVNQSFLTQLSTAAVAAGHRIFIPVGAGWGFDDIKKMADAGLLKTAAIEMEFHVDALRLNEPLLSALQDFIDDDKAQEVVLYEGNVQDLAPLAPNNTNTMCGLALAAHNLGFGQVQAKLKATKRGHAHKVNISIEGPDGFSVNTERINPAKATAVTGSLTFNSFLASLMACRNKDETGILFV